MAKSDTPEAAPVPPAEPTRAAVWNEQPEMMSSRALAVLTYLAQVARQVAEDKNDAYSNNCIRALGWNMVRMVGALRAAAEAKSPLDYVTYELDHPSMAPGDWLDRARECLIIIAEHHQYGDDMGFADEEDEEYGLAVLVEMALAFLEGAETAFDERIMGGGHGDQ